MTRALATEVRSRLVAQTGRTVYEFAVPDNPAPRYFLVSTSDTVTADTLGDVTRVHDSVLWVTSVSRNPDPVAAAREATWDREAAVTALTNWRPTTGAAAFKPVHLGGQPPQRDDDLPETVIFTVDRFGITYQ